jgi:hypothetical protein
MRSMFLILFWSLTASASSPFVVSTQVAQSVPYIDTLASPTLGATNVQSAIDALKSGTSTTVTTVSASLLTLTSASAKTQLFIGTTGGQSVKLPNATTLAQGATFELVNNSVTIIPVYYADGTTHINSLYPSTKTTLVVSDISSSNGVWAKQSGMGVTTESTRLFDDFVHAGTATNEIGNLGWALTSTAGTATWANQTATNPRVGVGLQHQTMQRAQLNKVHRYKLF